MNKVRSAICLTLITILIVGIVFMCTVSFQYGYEKMYTFNSILSDMTKDAQIGNDLLDKSALNYRGGGYTAVYFPEGVITEKEFNDNRSAYSDEDSRKEYEDGYVKLGSLYFEKDLVEDGKVTEDFQEEFDNAVAQLKERIRQLNMENARIDIRDTYSLQVYLPTIYAQGDSSEHLSVFNNIAHVGDLSVSYGSSADSATPINIYPSETINDYIESVSASTIGSTSVVAVNFTEKGKNWLTNTATADANSSSSVTLFFYVADTNIVSVSVSETVTGSTVYISNSSSGFSMYEARALAATMDTALRGDSDLSFTVGDVIHQKAQFGDLALVLMYVAFGVLFLGMMVFFFVRYKGLAFAHLYSFLIYLLPMILLVWGISFLHLNVWTFVAVVFGGILLSVCNAISYENARKEYALGKTMASAVKSGYKKCFWLIFDLHIVIALFAFVTYFIALTQLSVFAFTLGLAAVISGLSSLAVNRFHWAMFMTFTKNQGAFCNFKREDLGDE